MEDKQFLLESFVDNGELEILLNVNDPRCIILGRTGSGKTALLERIRSCEDRVIQIEPENLALNYVSNNEVLKFFIKAGVDMDLFFRLLWRHIFAVEILRSHYRITNEQDQENFLHNILQKFTRDRSKQEAIEYLRTWGGNFWKDSEYRVQEITQKFQNDLTRAISGTLSGQIPTLGEGGIELKAENVKSLTQEQKGEVVKRGQEVVDQVQIKTLSKVIGMLEKDLLDDKKKRYYVSIDRLDENWINDEFRYQLIRALLETVRDFNHSIENVKILAAIREDLLDRVFRFTRSPGYQEEKYTSMYLTLSWRRPNLESLLDLRVNQIIREQYTSEPVKLRDLFPSTINRIDPLSYFLDRTMYRPRDAIMFFNECIKAAEGKAKFTQSSIAQAEPIYSQNRLRALADEWSVDYPNLIELTFFLRKMPVRFRANELVDELGDKMLAFLTNGPNKQDVIFEIMTQKFEGDDFWGFAQEMLKILYRVGVVGLKPESFASVQWAHFHQKLFTLEILPDAIVEVHPAFWRVLGATPER